MFLNFFFRFFLSAICRYANFSRWKTTCAIEWATSPLVSTCARVVRHRILRWWAKWLPSWMALIARKLVRLPRVKKSPLPEQKCSCLLPTIWIDSVDWLIDFWWAICRWLFIENAMDRLFSLSLFCLGIEIWTVLQSVGLGFFGSLFCSCCYFRVGQPVCFWFEFCLLLLISDDFSLSHITSVWLF